MQMERWKREGRRLSGGALLVRKSARVEKAKAKAEARAGIGVDWEGKGMRRGELEGREGQASIFAACNVVAPVVASRRRAT